MKKLISVAIMFLVTLIVLNLYGTFVQPFIDPYFFKIDNVERIVGMKLPGSFMFEYEVEIEPSYRFAGTKGIKKIFAGLQIDEKTYELLKEKKYFDARDPVWSKEEYVESYILEKRNYKSFSLDNFAESKVIYYITPLGENVYHGFWALYRSGPSMGIFIVLLKIESGHDNETFFYRLIVFTND